MSLGLVSPLLNRGVRSRWLASLPGAGSKMLTIDSNGDTSFQDIPVAAWGSITGTLSAQTDLQSALNGKLSLTGGTLTGAVTSNLGTITSSTPALSINQTWNNTATTFNVLSANVVSTASAANSNWINFFSDYGGGYTSAFTVNAQTGAIDISSTVGMGSISLGSVGMKLSGVYATGLVIRQNNASQDVIIINNGYSDIGTEVQITSAPIGWSGLKLRRDAADTLALQRSTNAQTFRLYGTYTDASNYRRLYLSSTTAGAFTLGVEGAGTGASGNTLTVANATTFSSGATFGAGGVTLSGNSPISGITATNNLNGYSPVFATGNVLAIVTPSQFGGGLAIIASDGSPAFEMSTENKRARMIGRFQVGGSTDLAGQVGVQSGSTTTTTGVFRAAASETANIIEWQNNDGTVLASVSSSGALSAVTKSFLIDHPTKPGRKLQYGSLESPYHGIRLTGRSFIEGGIGVIELPDYVRAFVSDDVNIQLTPVGRNILWVDCIDLNNNQVIVGGDLDGDFYWSFTGIRTDVELEVEPWA